MMHLPLGIARSLPMRTGKRGAIVMDATTLQKAMPGADEARAVKYITGCNAALRHANCMTVKRVAMFLAQIGEESGSMRWAEEIASGAEYENRPDLGNVHPGDGVRFKGRGFIQITGRANYTALSQWAHTKGFVPSATYFVDEPPRLATDKYVWLGSVWYWTVARNMNTYADNSDIHGATLAVNGGLNGLSDRTSRWHLCLQLGNEILPAPGHKTWNSSGRRSLHDIALATGSAPSTILRLTAQNSPREMFPTDLADYVNGVFEMSTANMDEGLVGEHDVPGSTEIDTWTTGQHSSEPLAALATRLRTTPARTLQLTAEHPPGKMFPRLVALYINQVFTDDSAPVPSGITLYYPGS
jgi:predicted chitinase